MQTVKVYNLAGKAIEDIKLDPKVFGIEANPALVHQVLEVQRANEHIKLANTKTRSEVRGGGKKPWRQKGTGRARHGSSRSPIWIGGGITFGPRTAREFTKKINKKMKRIALFMCLSDKVKDNNLVVVDKLELAKIKTKELVGILQKLPTKNSSTLVILSAKDANIYKSARNIPKIKSILADSLNIEDVMKYNYLLIDKIGLKKIAEVYKK